MQSGGVSARRESSDYMPTRESHVDVPWQQAIRRGALIGGLVLVAGVGGLWVLSSVDWGMFAKMFDSRHPLSLEYIVKQIGWFKLIATGLIGALQ